MARKKIVDEDGYDPSPATAVAATEEPLLEAPIDMATDVVPLKDDSHIQNSAPVPARLYRKRPVVISAFRYWEEPRPDWFCDRVSANEIVTYPTHCEIQTLEGVMRGERGDFIIQGVKGEIYPCKPDIFEATYELVSPPGEAVADAPSILPKSVAQLAYERMVDQFDDAEVKFDSWEEMSPLVRKVFEERAESLEHDALFEECVRQVVENDLRDPAPSHPFPASSDAVIAPATATNS